MIDLLVEAVYGAVDFWSQKKQAFKDLLITGDHTKRAAQAIALIIGIFKERRYCFKSLGQRTRRVNSKYELKRFNWKQISVYARVSPENKIVRIVRCMGAK